MYIQPLNYNLVFISCYISNTTGSIRTRADFVLCILPFVAGISQRHTDMYQKFISENSAEIVSDIQAFFYHIIKDNFPDKNCKYTITVNVNSSCMV